MIDYGPEAASEQFRALWRAAIAVAYAHQVVRGHSIETMGYQINWTPDAVIDAMAVGENVTLSHISDLCCAMDCEPTFESINGKFVIGVHPNPPQRSETDLC